MTNISQLFTPGNEITAMLDGKAVTLRTYKGENTIEVNPVARDIIASTPIDFTNLKGNITMMSPLAQGVVVNEGFKSILNPNLNLNNFIRNNDGNATA